MNMSPTRMLCQNLIASAIRRCRTSDNLCRLSVILKTCPEFNPPSTRIAISDTGVGSCLTEFQNTDYGKDRISAENWDGVLFITTTSTTETEVHHYRLNLQGTPAKKKLTRLPSTSKRGRNFSGTEVSLTTHEDIVKWIIRLCQKIVVLKIPKVTIELVVENMNNSGTRFEKHLEASDGILLPSSLSNIERLACGLEEFVLRHGNPLCKEKKDCFLSRENLKIGKGTADGSEVSKGTVQMMEAVFVITEPKLSNPSMVADGTSIEVLFYHNFSPCPIPQSCLNALTSIDWQNYGLTFRDFLVDCDGNAVQQWEKLPFDHIYIALHGYNIKYPEVNWDGWSFTDQPPAGPSILRSGSAVTMVQTQQRHLEEKNLVKKAVKLALDDLKVKYPGFFLSPNSLKIRKHAPDLSKAIAGLILSSNDLEFHAECASLLGLDDQDVNNKGKIETCITAKLLGIIAMNDCKSSRGKRQAPLLFDDNASQKEDFQDEGDDGEGDVSKLDW